MKRVRLTGLPVVITLLLACTSAEDAGQTPDPSGSPAGDVPATRSTGATPVPGVTPPSGTTPATLVLDGTPRTSPPVQQRTLAPFTPSTLPVPDRMDTVLYDVAANTALNLGPGTMGQFSPDGKQMTWSTQALNNPTEVYVIDLATKQQRALALGRDPRFADSNRIVFFTGSQARTVIDLTTGQQTPFPDGIVVPDFAVTDIPGGTHRLRAMPPDGPAPASHSRYTVEETATANVILQFQAAMAAPAGVDEIVVATTMVNGMTNIYTVIVKTGASSYVATARWQPGNWPLAATEAYVAWTEAFCDFANPARTRVYDRRARTISELDRGFWVHLTPDNKLAVGEFGAKSLIDLSSLQASFVIPGSEMYDRGRDVSWSPDYRFASTGFVGGHGGLCG